VANVSGNRRLIGALFALASACAPAGNERAAGERIPDWEGTDNPAATSPEEFIAARYDALPDSERRAREMYFQTPIALRGRVLADDGTPVSGATVLLADQSVHTAVDGSFEMPSLLRLNGAASVTAAGFRSHWFGIHLSLPPDVAAVELPAIRLTPQTPGVVRFLFGGDTSFGRRFLDPLERYGRTEVPEDNPDALISVLDPLPGSREVLRQVAPLFAAVDYPVVNLESVVTRDPATPHLEKEFAYFTLPESLPALSELGVRYVSLGNNHVYDYLEQGIVDTLANVEAAGLQHSGAGRNAEEAFRAYRTDLEGHPYSFLSMSSVSGSQFSVTYNATDQKGGAADLRDDENVAGSIARELALARYPIVQIHTGREYSFAPTDYVMDRLALIAAQKPALIIGHHPHVAQGFGFHEGVFAVHSLGNFLFDQLRLDTMLSMMVQVDMRASALLRARAVPIYIEDSVPRLVVGPTAERYLRRIGELSAPHDAAVASELGWGAISRSADAPAVVERDVDVELAVDEQGWAIVDLRAIHAAHESVSSIELPAGTSGRLGRDVLEGHGDFEDIDVDDELFELSRWDVTGASVFPCLSRVYRGASALCSVRSRDNRADSVLPLRNRVRVLGDADHLPNKNLSLFGYVKGENAGELQVQVSYHASVGEAAFGDRVVHRRAGGDYDWTSIAVDLDMPADDPAHAQSYELNARALRVFFRQAAPESGEALLALDEVAIVNWDRAVADPGPELLATPHARDFLRVDATPGVYRIRLSLRGYERL
jgi:poly-gamma-glutamate capsule biosynthesis protein CapA/YwtB (metallophosphatase superfamily)